MTAVQASFQTVITPFPAGTVATGFLLTLTDTAPVAEGVAPKVITGRAGLDATQITIDNVPEGTYIGRVALVGAADAEVAPGVTDPAPITVATASTLTFPVPSSLTLTLP